jgi:hypothetical protein
VSAMTYLLLTAQRVFQVPPGRTTPKRN